MRTITHPAGVAGAENPDTTPEAQQVATFTATVIHGRGLRLASIPTADRRMTARLEVGTTVATLLTTVLDAFDIEDHEHLAELRFHPQRRKVGSDARTYPLHGTSDVWALHEHEYAWGDYRDGDVHNLFDVGEVGYLRFDFGDEWRHRVPHVVERA